MRLGARPWSLVVLAAMALTSGCEGCSSGERRRAPAPEADFGTGAGAPAAAAEAAVPPREGDVEACKEVCARTAECSLETAKQLAEQGNPYAKAAYERTKKGAEKRLSTCRASCDDGEMTEEGQAVIDACLDRETCKDFLACVTEKRKIQGPASDFATGERRRRE